MQPKDEKLCNKFAFLLQNDDNLNNKKLSNAGAANVTFDDVSHSRLSTLKVRKITLEQRPGTIRRFI